MSRKTKSPLLSFANKEFVLRYLGNQYCLKIFSMTMEEERPTFFMHILSIEDRVYNGGWL